MSVKKLSAEKILELERRMRVLGFQIHFGADSEAIKTMNAIAYLSHQLFVAENPDAGPSATERAFAAYAAAEAVHAGGFIEAREEL